MPKESPIIFSTPMVRAILEDKKTQTRRVIKPQPEAFQTEQGECISFRKTKKADGASVHTSREKLLKYSPYKIGHRLWVRENFIASSIYDAIKPSDLKEHITIGYPADESILPEWKEIESLGKTRPSIFMPRWASRITLEVAGVRVERVQDISEGDSLSEGLEEVKDGDGIQAGSWHGFRCGDFWDTSSRSCFADLWNLINAKRGFSWDANPWVWVVEFKRLQDV